MYILLHTCTYAITVYVLLRCIVRSICIFSTCLYIMCILYYIVYELDVYAMFSFLFIYLLLLTSSSNILFNFCCFTEAGS